MIVDDFYVVRVLFLPNETDAVLVVDSDTVLAGAISLQRLESVSGQCSKIRQSYRSVSFAKLPMRDVCNSLEFRNPLAIEDCSSVAVAEAPDHKSEGCTCRIVRQAYDAKDHRIKTMAVRAGASPSASLNSWVEL